MRPAKETKKSCGRSHGVVIERNWKKIWQKLMEIRNCRHPAQTRSLALWSVHAWAEDMHGIGKSSHLNGVRFPACLRTQSQNDMPESWRLTFVCPFNLDRRQFSSILRWAGFSELIIQLNSYMSRIHIEFTRMYLRLIPASCCIPLSSWAYNSLWIALNSTLPQIYKTRRPYIVRARFQSNQAIYPPVN
jgi:hypothetical protein